MDAVDILRELFGRVPEAVDAALAGLDDADLVVAPGEGNPIGWLLWHSGRVIDAQLAEMDGAPQIWGPEWAARFGLPPDAEDTGYGHTYQQVQMVRTDVHALREYLAAVQHRGEKFLVDLTPKDLEHPVGTVTWGVRLASIVEDVIAHLGQAAYVRGLIAGIPAA
jgi:hypothetical protein